MGQAGQGHHRFHSPFPVPLHAVQQAVIKGSTQIAQQPGIQADRLVIAGIS
ncbi:hypothetical protein D3C75_1287740 [compost metagenome]